ncbi:hypothetical protein V7201_10235 [Bacillus sp. JJ1122]
MFNNPFCPAGWKQTDPFFDIDNDNIPVSTEPYVDLDVNGINDGIAG